MKFNVTKGSSAAAIIGAAAFAVVSLPGQAGDLSVNASVGSNYLWRGISLTDNNPVVQVGIDYTLVNGLYAGSWITPANYGIAGVKTFQQDFYAGYAYEFMDVRWDLGYRYSSFDWHSGGAGTDFGEVYFRASTGGFTGAAYVLTNTEAEEGATEDFGAGKTFHVSADYDFEIGWGTRMGFHLGYSDGDFAEAFIGSAEGYFDYNVNFSKAGFKLTVADTNVSGPTTEGSFDNDELKVVLSYSIDINL